MNLLQATTSSKNKAWIDDEKLRVVFETDDDNAITGVSCTIKEENVTKTFKPKGRDPNALVLMFQQMESFIGKIISPHEIQERKQKKEKTKLHKVEKRVPKRFKKSK